MLIFLHFWNGYIIYVDIMTGWKLWSINVVISTAIYWPVCSYSRRGGDRVKRVVRGIVILASYKFPLIRILVLNPLLLNCVLYNYYIFHRKCKHNYIKFSVIILKTRMTTSISSEAQKIMEWRNGQSEI